MPMIGSFSKKLSDGKRVGLISAEAALALRAVMNASLADQRLAIQAFTQKTVR